ncbi:hypothetical protein XBJ2_1610008 [Xenorhabdus bovienii str. Jollieti]|uniref:Uncharacterized protein n=1 Tax=Xenorhabdus bovienii (strain SS-2004) TaxID=406818 RepID=D3V8M9_XENBS|nr:hypothetical protein XBJ1_3067 [Xenorhabdus bovienii SS-2004]CDH28051.1 hypothetical protein XBJ2_1610008 [Xenorhabdus bovienii str. Jollieti]
MRKISHTLTCEYKTKVGIQGLKLISLLGSQLSVLSGLFMHIRP